MKPSDSIVAIAAGMPITGRVSGLSPFFDAAIRETQERGILINEIAQISGIGVDDVRVLAGAVRFTAFSVAGWLRGIKAALLAGEIEPAYLRELIRRNKEPMGASDGKQTRS